VRSEIEAIQAHTTRRQFSLRLAIIWIASPGESLGRKSDVVIAQGLEAGGHRGMFLTDALTTQLGTFALVPQVVAAVKVPVVAAGGIADANGVAAAMALGAAGVQVATAYLLCPEATTSALHRQAIQRDAARHMALTNLFTGRPARHCQPVHAGAGACEWACTCVSTCHGCGCSLAGQG
jgi:hypothetical protein